MTSNSHIAKTSDFDEIYMYKGHYMINDRIEDEEGFYKNWYQWATDNHNGTITIHKCVMDTSSYTSWKDAVSAFKKMIDLFEK